MSGSFKNLKQFIQRQGSKYSACVGVGVGVGGFVGVCVRERERESKVSAKKCPKVQIIQKEKFPSNLFQNLPLPKNAESFVIAHLKERM